MANCFKNKDVSPQNQHFQAITLYVPCFLFVIFYVSFSTCSFLCSLTVCVSGSRYFPQKQKQPCFRRAQLLQDHTEDAMTHTFMMPAVTED